MYSQKQICIFAPFVKFNYVLHIYAMHKICEVMIEM